jgi:hypothetical protein
MCGVALISELPIGFKADGGAAPYIEMVINSFTFQGTSQLSSAVLTTFPDDHFQVSYTDLAGLQSLSEDARGRQSFDPSLPALADWMGSSGIDPTKDIDEVMLGWRDETIDSSKTMGLVAGRFKPHELRQYSERAGLAIIPYKAPTFTLLAPQARLAPDTLLCSETPCSHSVNSTM